MQAINQLRSRMGSNNGDERSSNLLAAASSSSKGQVQVEPKTYFANERTFIQWISASLLLLTVSSVLMSGGNYNGTSSFIAFSSLILVGYASYVYFRRVYRLRSGDAYGYLDFLGPSILAAGVGIGVFIVFADAIKGSEFLPFGSGDKSGRDWDDRRFLMSPPLFSQEQESAQLQREICSRHTIQGINLLEYQPRDILFHDKANQLLAVTPQALISHSQLDNKTSKLLTEIPNSEIQSVSMAGDRLFALSTGPSKTELIEFTTGYEAGEERFLIKSSTSASGSMAYVPSTESDQGSLYIHLDGSIHRYHLPCKECKLEVSGSVNMKVFNRGQDLDPIIAMEHFEGLLYVLRKQVVEAWDMTNATLVDEIRLPEVSKKDKWAGIAFERRSNEPSLLRKSLSATGSSVYLHMSLDSFPPQHWSFRLSEDLKSPEQSIFSFPDCAVSMN